MWAAFEALAAAAADFVGVVLSALRGREIESWPAVVVAESGQAQAARHVCSLQDLRGTERL